MQLGRRSVTIDGVTHTVREWANENRIPMGVISSRIHVLGWSIEKALTTKPMSRAAAGRVAADKMRFVLPAVGKISPEFVPGVRKPRADRKQQKCARVA